METYYILNILSSAIHSSNYTVHIHFINYGVNQSLKQAILLFTYISLKPTLKAHHGELHVINFVIHFICSCSLKATKCNLASMIYMVKMLSQVTENSSNIHLWLKDLNSLYVSLKAAFSVHILFLKPTCSVTNILIIR